MLQDLAPLSATELQQYFARIGFIGKPTTDLCTLQALHQLHPQQLAFENLSSWTGAQVSLVPDAVFNKLVGQGRGGYCFEHNQLFMRVLRALGFTVDGLSARVRWMLPETNLLPRTHMALLVSLDARQYLLDVGFGGLTMTAPLDLGTSSEQSTPHELFKISQRAQTYQVNALIAGQWQALYEFTKEPYLAVDYETANWYVSTHPQSRFTNELIVTRADSSGRHVLNNTRYMRHLPERASESKEILTGDELKQILQNDFKIDLRSVEALDQKILTLFES